MTPSRLLARVTVETCALVTALAALAAALGGTAAALGVAAGGALAVVNFRWLAARAAAAVAAGVAPGLAWLATTGLRLAASALTCGVLFVTGAAHPVALLAGLTVLPCVLLARGLADARETN